MNNTEKKNQSKMEYQRFDTRRKKFREVRYDENYGPSKWNDGYHNFEQDNSYNRSSNRHNCQRYKDGCWTINSKDESYQEDNQYQEYDASNYSYDRKYSKPSKCNQREVHFNSTEQDDSEPSYKWHNMKIDSLEEEIDELKDKLHKMENDASQESSYKMFTEKMDLFRENISLKESINSLENELKQANDAKTILENESAELKENLKETFNSLVDLRTENQELKSACIRLKEEKKQVVQELREAQERLEEIETINMLSIEDNRRLREELEIKNQALNEVYINIENFSKGSSEAFTDLKEVQETLDGSNELAIWKEPQDVLLILQKAKHKIENIEDNNEKQISNTYYESENNVEREKRHLSIDKGNDKDAKNNYGDCSERRNKRRKRNYDNRNDDRSFSYGINQVFSDECFTKVVRELFRMRDVKIW